MRQNVYKSLFYTDASAHAIKIESNVVKVRGRNQPLRRSRGPEIESVLRDFLSRNKHRTAGASISFRRRSGESRPWLTQSFGRYSSSVVDLDFCAGLSSHCIHRLHRYPGFKIRTRAKRKSLKVTRIQVSRLVNCCLLIALTSDRPRRRSFRCPDLLPSYRVDQRPSEAEVIQARWFADWLGKIFVVKIRGQNTNDNDIAMPACFHILHDCEIWANITTCLRPTCLFIYLFLVFI